MSSCGVCPSVCVCVTFVSCVKRNKDIFEIFSQSGSQAVLVFCMPNGMAIFRREPPNEDVECRWGIAKKRDYGGISGFIGDLYYGAYDTIR